MTREECLKIISDECLSHYNLDDHDDEANEVVIRYRESRWCVYATNERASMISEGCKYFNDEFEAYDAFIRRLRACNRYFNL